MDELPWFRMYHEFATDPKVQRLSEADQRRYVMLLCSRCCNGFETLHDDDIAFQLRITPEQYAETKANLMAKNLITDDNLPVSWDKRQFVSDSSTARVRAYRKRKKRSGNVTCNADETKRNVIDTDTDTDTDKGRPTPPPAHAHAHEADGGDGDGERLPDFAELRGMLEAEGWTPLKLVRINSAIAGWLKSRVTVAEFRHALETFRASPANAKRAPPANYLTSVIESTRLERAETFDTVSATASDTGDELTAEQVAAMWGEEPPETFERIDHSARIIEGETINTHGNKDKNQ